MRLIHTSVATVAVLAVSGTAFAAGTKDQVDARMGGTARVQSGGELRLIVQRRTSTAEQFRVTIKYDVTIRSKTVIGFVAHPCKSTSCVNQSISKITLFPGLRHVTFTGRVPVKRRADGTACVYAQLRDQGPKGRAPGKIVRRANGRKGVTFCGTVK
jgi:hypothetical protein